MDWLPEVALVPDQPPEAVQEVALVEDQLRVEAPPLVTEVGFAVSDTVGSGGAAVTVTVADALALPPAPVQVRVKLPFAVRAPVDWLPEVALVPDQPPEAVQEVALVEDQVRVEAPPLVTEVGFAVSETVGTGGAAVTVTVADALALPPAPVQVRVKLPLAVSAPVDWLPEVALVPDQPPEAVQEVALVEDQVRVEAPPLVTEVGFAVSDTVGTGGCGAPVSTHSRAVVPSQDGLCGVPTPFLSVTSLGRGFRLRYQIRFWPAVVDIGFAISAWMSATDSSPE